MPVGKDSALGGHEKQLAIVAFMFVFFIISITFIVQTDTYFQIAGYGTFVIAVCVPVIYIIKKYAFFDFNVLLFTGQAERGSPAKRFILAFRNYIRITNQDTLAEMEGMIREEERAIPQFIEKSYRSELNYELSKNGVESEKRVWEVKHYFYAVNSEEGTHKGPVGLIIPAPVEFAFQHHAWHGLLVGDYIRRMVMFESGGGNFRGYAGWKRNIQLSKLQRFLKALRLKKYIESDDVIFPVYYATDSTIHRLIPEMVIAPLTISPEWEERKATQMIAFYHRPLMLELQDAHKSYDELQRVVETKLEKDWIARPSKLNIGEAPKKSVVNKNLFVALIVMFLTIFAILVYSGAIPLPPAQTQTSFNEVTIPANSLPEMVRRGAILKSCDEASQLCRVMLPAGVRP